MNIPFEAEGILQFLWDAGYPIADYQKWKNSNQYVGYITHESNLNNFYYNHNVENGLHALSIEVPYFFIWVKKELAGDIAAAISEYYTLKAEGVERNGKVSDDNIKNLRKLVGDLKSTDEPSRILCEISETVNQIHYRMFGYYIDSREDD